MKTITKLFLSIIGIGLLIPASVFAVTSVPWITANNATTTPSRINGVDLEVRADHYVATSTTATSRFKGPVQIDSNSTDCLTVGTPNAGNGGNFLHVDCANKAVQVGDYLNAGLGNVLTVDGGGLTYIYNNVDVGNTSFEINDNGGTMFGSNIIGEGVFTPTDGQVFTDQLGIYDATNDDILNITGNNTHIQVGGMLNVNSGGHGDGVEPVLTVEGSSPQTGDYIDVQPHSGTPGQLLIMKSNGNVGINTDTPDSTLTVNGTESIENTDGGSTFNFGLDSSNFGFFFSTNECNSDPLQVVLGASDDCVIDADQNGGLNLGEINTSAGIAGLYPYSLSVEGANGNPNDFFVGIATSTPAAQLSVQALAGVNAFAVGSSTKNEFLIDKNGAISIGTTTAGVLNVSSTGKVYSSTGGGTGTVNTGIAGQAAFYNANGTAVSATSTLVFGTTTADANNIGIGSTSPFAKLSVQGQAFAQNFNAYSSTTILQSSGTTILAANASDIFIGNGSGNTTASGNGNNVGIGATTLAQISSGTGNMAIGPQAGAQLTNGFNNALIGIQAGTQYSSGARNVAIGTQATEFNVSGTDNVTIGGGAGFGTNGNSYSSDTFIGSAAANNVTSGSSNVCIGVSSCASLSSGGSNIVIGPSANVVTGSASNFLNIGNSIYGNTSTGLIGIGTTTPFAKLSIHDTSGLAGTNTLFAIASSTSANIGTTTLLSVFGNGNVNIGGTTTPNDNLLINQPIALLNNSTENRALEIKTAGNEIFGVGAYDNSTNPVIFIGSPNGNQAGETTRIYNGLTGTGALDFFSSFLNFSTTAGTLFTGTGATLQIQDQNNSSGAANIQSGPLEFRDYLGTISNFHIDQILNIPNTSGTIDRLAFNLNRASQSGGTPYEGMSLLYDGVSSGRLGIGSTSPWGKLSVNPIAVDTGPEFVVGSSTATQLIVANGGSVGIGSTSPTASLTVQSNSSTLNVISIATTTTKMLSWIDAKGNQYTGGDVPTINSCGSGATLETGSNNTSGRIFVGSTALLKSCVINFADGGFTSTPRAPVCWTDVEGIANTFAVTASSTQTTLTIDSANVITSTTITYGCIGH